MLYPGHMIDYVTPRHAALRRATHKNLQLQSKRLHRFHKKTPRRVTYKALDLATVNSTKLAMLEAEEAED